MMFFFIGLIVAAYLAYLYGFSMIIGIALVIVSLWQGKLDLFNWKKAPLYLFLAGMVIILMSGYGLGFQMLNQHYEQIVGDVFK